MAPRLITENGRFVCRCTFMEKETPKRAGFQWDRDRKHWYTSQSHVAVRLLRFADEATKAKLGGTVVAKPGEVALTLTYDETKQQYVAMARDSITASTCANRGFTKSGTGAKWTCRDSYFAAKLVGIAQTDEATLRHIRESESVRLARLELSRAQDSDYPIPCPDGLAFYPFQRNGISYAMQCFSSIGAALIADEMGLGKTPQGIGVINCVERHLAAFGDELRNVLVICPPSVKLNWKAELRRWLTAGNLIIRLVSAQHWPRPHSFLEQDAGQIVVIHPHILHKYRDKLLATAWDLIIIDEAHMFLNPATRWTKMLMGWEDHDTDEATGKRVTVKHPPIPARYKLALTGTPIKNRTRELFTLLHHLDPQMWHNRAEYVRRYAAAGMNADTGKWDENGASNLGELQERLRGWAMVRREMSQVMPELPPLTRQLIELELPSLLNVENKMLDELGMSRAEFVAWKAGATISSEDEGMAQIDKLQERAFGKGAGAEQKARKEAGLAIVPTALEIIGEVTEDHKLLAFFHHREVGERIRDEFNKKHPKGCEIIYGGMDAEIKQAIIERAWHDPELRVVLMSITMAVGMNLQCMWHMLFIEPDYVPGVMDQAAGRCRRIGQGSDHVLAQYLAPQGSLLSEILRVQWEKAAVIKEALDKAVAA